MIDINPDRINEITDEVDAMGVVGNGASINTLMEAGIETADILIAVTVSDEMNLLCCLIAQKTGHCHTIARVRNPIYSKEIGLSRASGCNHDHSTRNWQQHRKFQNFCVFHPP
mgnify:CR=1 FL=1